jgi:hypothetical protein
VLTAPPGFSQPAASFFGPVCLGIHRVLFLASFHVCQSLGTAVLPRITLHLVRSRASALRAVPVLDRYSSHVTSFGLVKVRGTQKSPATAGPRYRRLCRCSNVYLVVPASFVSKTEVPSGTCHKNVYYSCFHSDVKVGDPGLEPGASPLSEECSNQLS